MKEYVARFGHGTAKLARQGKSKEKLLNKKLSGGLTERPVEEKMVRSSPPAPRDGWTKLNPTPRFSVPLRSSSSSPSGKLPPCSGGWRVWRGVGFRGGRDVSIAARVLARFSLSARRARAP